MRNGFFFSIAKAVDTLMTIIFSLVRVEMSTPESK